MSFLFLFVGILFICVEGFKVLVIFPIPGKSHVILGDSLVDHLLEAGHEVTYITPIPRHALQNFSNENLHEIDISTNFPKMPVAKMDIEKIMDKKIFTDSVSVLSSVWAIHKITMENKNVQELINDESKEFDVIVAEYTYSDLYAGLSALFNCPFIWISPYEPSALILSLIDEEPNAAYTPDSLSLNVPPMNFPQRVRELYTQVTGIIMRKFYTRRVELKAYEDLIVPAILKRGKIPISFNDVIYKIAMVLSNGHESLGIPIKLPPNHKYIGGYHIDRNTKALPQDLQNLMDNAENGVIYFSMGSNMQSKEMPREMKTGLLKMFAKLKQTVIWKFEEALENVPTNVHIVRWAAQQSILSHPNLSIFITHGGYLSINEAVHFGVPIIGIPVFGDQFNNVYRAVSQGYARSVGIAMNLEYDLKVAIDDMISNPKYRQTVKQLSEVYRDRLVSPGKELVHWVEYVVKTKGAPHLRSTALKTPWYQKIYLDLIVSVLAIVYFIKLLLAILYNWNSGRVIKSKTN